MSGLCAGCGAAVAPDSLFCPRCGTPVGPRPPIPSVPPLPLIGTIGRAEPNASRPPAPPSGVPASARRRRGAALCIDLLPFLLLAGVAMVGWLQPIAAWGRLSGRGWFIVGAAGILLLLVQASFLVAGGSFGRACTGAPRRARRRRAGSTRRPAVQDRAPLGPATGEPSLAGHFAPPPGSLLAAPPGLLLAAPPGRLFQAPPSWSAAPHVQPKTPPAAAVAPAARWRLVLDNGRSLYLNCPTVIGRDPAALPGEADVLLLAIPDETRTVSKTHVKLDPGTDSVLVTDRHSTNGVVVIAAGVATRCRAGEPMMASAGSVVRFGDREMQVRRA